MTGCVIIFIARTCSELYLWTGNYETARETTNEHEFIEAL